MAVNSDFQAPRTSKFAALPLLEKVAVAIEDLNARVCTISDVDPSLIVDCDTVRRIELTRLVTLVTPVEKELSLGGELGQTTVAIPVRDVELAVRSHRDVGRLVEVVAVEAGDLP